MKNEVAINAAKELFKNTSKMFTQAVEEGRETKRNVRLIYQELILEFLGNVNLTFKDLINEPEAFQIILKSPSLKPMVLGIIVDGQLRMTDEAGV